MNDNKELIERMTNAFLQWPLPESVCADPCATKQSPGRIGTNLLSFIEARQMIKDVVGPVVLELAVEVEAFNNECDQLIKERDEAEDAANEMASNILREPIDWSDHQGKWREAIDGSAAPSTPPAPASLAGEKEEMPRWAIHAASEVLWGPSGPMVPSDGLSIDEQIEMEKTAAIIAKHSFSAALTPGDAGGFSHGDPGESDKAVKKFAVMQARIAELEAEVARWSKLAQSNARAGNLTEDERFALFLENKELKAQLEATPPAARPPARPATDGKDGERLVFCLGHKCYIEIDGVTEQMCNRQDIDEAMVAQPRGDGTGGLER